LTIGLALGNLLIVGAFVRTAVAGGYGPAGSAVSPVVATASPAATTVPATVSATPTPSVTLRPVPVPAQAAPVASRPIPVPSVGPGTFLYAAGGGRVLGRAGTVRRFRVAVEHGMGQDPAEFAASVDAVLGDPRSWIASGTLRLQRVPMRAGADFTIFLATPGTSERMCRHGGLDTGGFTSCRLSGKVIINVARWLRAVPGYRAPLAVYRAYAINHEVGHQLGHRHEACPGRGRLAPVMQQQTFGLRGCLAYAWPYLDGRRYAGPLL
jgi:hypothetical protein